MHARTSAYSVFTTQLASHIFAPRSHRSKKHKQAVQALEKEHRNSAPIECVVCGLPFPSVTQLRKHERYKQRKRCDQRVRGVHSVN